MSTENRFLAALHRIFQLSSDVRRGETARVALLLLNLLVVLLAYYVLKTVREPLILNDAGAELKSYAAGFQAVLLVLLLPLYSRLAARVDRLRLIVGLHVFYVACIEIFALLSGAGPEYLGFVFYVWLGIFSVSAIAQFWSYANDLYTEGQGERLFPVVAIGATLGAPLGSFLASRMFDGGFSIAAMMHGSAVLLLGSLGLYAWIEKLGERRREEEEPMSPASGLGLVLRSRYLRLVALLLIALNLVNTTGEYILGEYVVEAAKQAVAVDPSIDRDAWIGSFYGEFYSVVNVAAIGLQVLLVSRLVRFLGLAGVLFALPVVAFGTYGLIAAGVGLTVVRWAKTAENATDYSVMNTARALLWLPTSRDEKYKAKQAVDTFFVRVGDVLSAGLVFVGSSMLELSPPAFARVNLVVIAAWVGIAVLVWRENRRLVREEEEAEEPHPLWAPTPAH